VIVAPQWGLVSAVRYVGLRLLGLFAWDVVVAVLYCGFNQTWIALDNLPMPLIGTSLALLVAVRNNNAYARWWEARQLWGGVVNYSRTLARQVRLYVPDASSATVMVELQVAFAHALRCHLRRQEPWLDIAPFVAPDLLARLRASSNVPEALLSALADRLATLRRAGTLDTIALTAFDATLAELANMQGGLEIPGPRPHRQRPRESVRELDPRRSDDRDHPHDRDQSARGTRPVRPSRAFAAAGRRPVVARLHYPTAKEDRSHGRHDA
jgi:putative membrane protein